MPRLIFPLLLILCGCWSCREDRRLLQLEELEKVLFVRSDSVQAVLDSMDYASMDPLPAHDEAAALWGMMHVWNAYRSYQREIPEMPLATAFAYFCDSDDPHRRAQVYYLRSAIHEDQKRGTEEEWDADMFTACRYVAETDDHVLAAQIYQRYGAKCDQRRDYAEAAKWVEKYYEEATLSHNVGDQVRALLNLSNIWIFIEDEAAKQQAGTTDGATIAQYTAFPEAHRYIRQAQALAEQTDQATLRSMTYRRLSHYFSRRQMGDSALYFALLSKDMDEQLWREGKRHDPVSYMYVADAYRKVGMADSALKYALLDIHHPKLLERANASHLLYMIYEDMFNDSKKAVEWQSRYFLQKDSLHANDISTALVHLQQNNDLKHEEMIQEEKGMSWIILIVVVFAIGLLLRARVVRIYHQQRLDELEREMNQRIDRMNQMVEKRSAEVDNAVDKPVDNIINPQSQPEEGRLIVDNSVENGPIPVEKPVENLPIPEMLTLAGSTRESLTIQPDQLLYITSESNYLKVVYAVEEGHLQQKLLRMTMTQAEAAIAPFPHIQRCHRAFIVNIRQVIRFSSNSGSYLLRLRDCHDQVPVSKTYLATIREALK